MGSGMGSLGARQISRRSLLRAGLVAGTAAAAAACSKSEGGQHPGDAAQSPSATTPAPSRSAAPTSTGPAPAPSPTAPDPADVKANELGLVPVMMYHRITPKIAGEFDMTPSDFRAQLRLLFSRGFRPIRTIDLVRGEIPVAAGYHPVVLTFDDGYANQFAVSSSGEVDPDSAAGIILSTCKEFPDCSPAGSFNVNENPFGLTDADSQRVGLGALNGLGFEIANHTYHHDDLSKLTPVQVAEDLVLLQQLVERAVPGVQVRTLALPFGSSPKPKSLAHAGSWHGESYLIEGVLLVGAEPSHSPFSAKFDPLAIPRIRGTSWKRGSEPYTARFWLERLKSEPENIYTAAGNPGHVTIPKQWSRYLDRRHRSIAVTY